MKRVALLNPLDMVPASVEETTAAPVEKVETTAGHFLHDVHICPACKRPMKLLTVSRRTDPIESWVCVQDRISLPLKNS